MPPGLQPRASPGGARLRAAGQAIQFPKEGQRPSFHLIEGSMSQAAAATDAGPRHTLDLSDLSSAPALVGRPSRVRFRRLEDERERLAVDAVFDHRGEAPRDSLLGRLDQVQLPPLALPGTGLTLVPGAGSVALTAVLEDDRFVATWTLHAGAAGWRSEDEQPGELAGLLRAALTGISRLEVTASVGGSLGGIDEFRVRSNIDDAVARGLQAALGATLDAARAQARTEVDRLSRSVADSAVTAARTALDDATSGVTAWRAEVVGAREELERQLQAKTAGIPVL